MRQFKVERMLTRWPKLADLLCCRRASYAISEKSSVTVPTTSRVSLIRATRLRKTNSSCARRRIRHFSLVELRRQTSIGPSAEIIRSKWPEVKAHTINLVISLYRQRSPVVVKVAASTSVNFSSSRLPRISHPRLTTCRMLMVLVV